MKPVLPIRSRIKISGILLILICTSLIGSLSAFGLNMIIQTHHTDSAGSLFLGILNIIQVFLTLAGVCLLLSTKRVTVSNDYIDVHYILLAWRKLIKVSDVSSITIRPFNINSTRGMGRSTLYELIIRRGRKVCIRINTHENSDIEAIFAFLSGIIESVTVVKQK